MGIITSLFGDPAPKCVATCSEWKQLKLDCPGEDCTSDGFEPTYWQHHGCGGSTEINSEAILRCARCKDPYSILYGTWSCDKHNGKFLKTDKKKLVAAMSVASAMYKDMGANVWVKRLVKSVSNLAT